VGKILMVSLGGWSSSSGRWFVRERIYRHGYVWTPFVWMRFRYFGKTPRETFKREES
jgi:hypothetical protein